MQFTELLFQRVSGLGTQGQIALRPGYVAVVCKQPALRAAFLAALQPGSADESKLAEGQGPTRVGLGLSAPSGVSYRLLRELGGERQLQRLEPNDAGGTRFELLSKDSLDIESFLRIECGLPPPEQYAAVFVLDAAELPSQRGKQVQAAPAVDGKRVETLKAELEATRAYEEAQDQLFKVAVKHRELEELVEVLRKAEDALAQLDSKRGKAAYSKEQQADLAARIKRVPESLRKRDDELRAIDTQRDRLLEGGSGGAMPFHKNSLFSGGLLAGVVIDILAIALKKPAVALLGLVGFGAALVAVLQWIAHDEEEEAASHRTDDLKLREDRVKRAYEAEQAPLREALKKAKLTDPDELLTLFNELGEFEAERKTAVARVEQLKEDPRLKDCDAELLRMGKERHELEQAVATQGFARPINQIEGELKQALGLAASSQQKKAPVAEDEVPKQLFARAAEVLNTPAAALFGMVEQRLAAYLTALTDRRVVSARLDANGLLLLAGADGRSGPYASLPTPLRDLAYVAVRLALLERVTLSRKAPVIVDDAFAPLEPRARTLLARMLKGIAAQAQVVHRMTEAPPPGVADHQVQLP